MNEILWVANHVIFVPNKPVQLIVGVVRYDPEAPPLPLNLDRICQSCGRFLKR